MAINIKNEAVSRQAVELAKVMGESITDAVGKAIQEKLERVEGSGRKGIAAKLKTLSETCVRNAPASWLTFDYDAELYDERGMPR